MRQRLGQHFLKNKEVLEKEVAALELKNGETVIEIGPGRGALTEEILKIKNKIEKMKVVAIEKDSELGDVLKVLGFSEDGEELKIIKGDVLKVLPLMIQDSRFKIHDYKIVGNIPYYLTGYLLRIIGELKNKPSVCVFIIQKEVAERMTAKPPYTNKLAASVQFWANVEILRLVSRKDFSPTPEVESALIRLKVLGDRLKIEEKKYYEVASVLFRQPRKTILNNLADSIYSGNTVDKQLRHSRDTKHRGDTVEIRSKYNGLSKGEIEEKLKRAGFQPNLRPQDLSVEEIIKISEILNEH